MSSLESLRSRLAKLSQQQSDSELTWPRGEQSGTITQDGSTFHTSNTTTQVQEDTHGMRHHIISTDLTVERDWLQRLQGKRSSAEEWLAFLQHLSDNVTFTSENNKLLSLIYHYSKALKCVSEESTKHESYGQLQVKFAQLKGQQSLEDGQKAFSAARSNARRFAFVHVAAAQFEVDHGNTQQARKILRKAKDKGAEPAKMITTAMRNLISDRPCLLSDSDQGVVQSAPENKENQPQEPVELLLPRKSWLGKTQDDPTPLTSSACSTITPPAPETQPRKPSVTSSSGGNSRRLAVYTDVLRSSVQEKGGVGSTDDSAMDVGSVKMKNATNTEDSSMPDQDSQPFIYVTQRGSRRPAQAPLPNLLQDPSPSSIPQVDSTAPLEREGALEEPTPRTLRSCHSTPDCKKPGVLSASLFNKPKRFTGKPLRVLKRTGLPELQERGGETQGDEEDSIHLAPLPEITDDPHLPGVDSVDGAPQPMNTGQPSGRVDSNGDSGIIMRHTGEILSPEVFHPQDQKDVQSQGMNCSEGQGQKESQGPTFSMATAESVPQAGIVPSLPQPSLPPAQTPAAAAAAAAASQAPIHPSVAPSQPVGAMVGPVPTPGMQPQPAPTGPAAAPFMCTPMGKQPEVLTVNGNSYMALRMIGRGGSSKVYEVLSCTHTRLCAIKCVNLDCADDATIQSYRNEIELLSKLQYSDRIIKMYDFEYNEDRAMLYVVMERGDTDLMSYFRRCKKQGDMHPLKVRFYWMEMLQAVQVLQKEGIVHSDLKPANFLLVEGHLKLIDFGIANAIQQDMTSVMRDQQIGTLNYMSPEAIMDVGGSGQLDEMGRPKPRFKIGVKSDVWSLGCMLYNMVYNCTPFQKVANALKLQAIINPAYKIEFPQTDDPHLLDTLQKCLQRDPKQRPSIQELLSHPYLQQM